MRWVLCSGCKSCNLAAEDRSRRPCRLLSRSWGISRGRDEVLFGVKEMFDVERLIGSRSRMMAVVLREAVEVVEKIWRRGCRLGC